MISNHDLLKINEFVSYIWNEAIGDIKSIFEFDLNKFNLTIEEVKY
jgi:hypothetical protein